MTQPKPQYKIGEIFFSEKHQEYCVIEECKYITTVKGGSRSAIHLAEINIQQWSYICKYPSKGPVKFRTYYEERLSDEFELITNKDRIEMVKLLYE